MSVARNLSEVHARIERACESVSRDPAGVTLVVISKLTSVRLIQEVYDAGHRHFGENRLQEALPKIAALPSDIHWHFVGHLQSNKAKKVAAVFNTVHTLESESQLVEFVKQSRRIGGFIEVNIANEAQKTGISTLLLDEFAKTVLHYSQVHLLGLMTMGPLLGDPELSRMYFRKLRNLAEQQGFQSLSMGMSQDFDVAIQEGATHIRVGSAIFGSRT